MICSKTRILATVATLATCIGCGCGKAPEPRSTGPSISVVPASGEGDAVSFVVTVSPGAQRMVGLLLNTGIDARESCYVLYEVATNNFMLVNDSGYGSKTLNGNSTVDNARCTLAAAGTRAESVNEGLKLRFALTFKPSFAGGKNVYIYTQQKPDVVGQFQSGGAWMVAP